MTTQRYYEYADGSANVYKLTGTTLEYDPIRPEESSTGTYSGGNPKTVTLTNAQADSLRVLMDKGFANTSVQIPDRVKGSGLIRIGDGKDRKQCILVQGCAEIKTIEGALKKCLE